MKQANRRRTRRIHLLWLPGILTVLLLLFFSWNTVWQASQAQQMPHPQVRPTPTPTNSIPITSHNNSSQTDTNDSTDITSLHQFLGPNGWIWRTSLPDNRLVI